MLINLYTTHPQYSNINDQTRIKYLQEQLQELLLSTKLKNRILLGTFQDNQWQEVKLIVPLSIPVINFNHLTQIKFLFRFDHNWPNTSPGIYIQGQHIQSQLWYTNIMQIVNWSSDQPKSIQYLMQKLIKELDSIGLLQWLRNMKELTKKYCGKCIYGVNQINNNYNNVDKSNLNKYNYYTHIHKYHSTNLQHNHCTQPIQYHKLPFNELSTPLTTNYPTLPLKQQNKPQIKNYGPNKDKQPESQKQSSKLSSSHIFQQQHYQNKQYKQLQTNSQDICNSSSKTKIKKQIINHPDLHSLNILNIAKQLHENKLDYQTKNQEKLFTQRQLTKNITINPGFVPYRPSVQINNKYPFFTKNNQLNLKCPNISTNFTKTDQSLIENQCQNIFDLTFQHQPNKTPKPMNKNANLPKFLIRIFIKYLQKYKTMYIKKQYDNLITQCKKMKQWKKNDRRQHAFGLKHLKIFFQDKIDGFPDPNINRKVIFKIIDNFLLEEICQNSQIPESHRTGYLVACRVYSIRCRNANLAGRIQSK